MENKFIALIIIYGTLILVSILMLKVFNYLKNLGKHMIDKGYIEANFFGAGQPKDNTPVTDLYARLYYVNFLVAIFLIKAGMIFLIIMFIAQVISLCITGNYFRNHILFA